VFIAISPAACKIGLQKTKGQRPITNGFAISSR
jgi:hypothetical protein